MEKMIPFITIGGGVLTALFVAGLLIRKAFKWKDMGGLVYDLSGLSNSERLSVGLCAKGASLAILGHLNGKKRLKGIRFRIRILKTDKQPFAGAAATAQLERRWPWTKKEWVVVCMFRNSRNGEMWYEFIPHELFGHIAYVEVFGERNQGHTGNEFSADETAMKAALRTICSSPSES